MRYLHTIRSHGFSAQSLLFAGIFVIALVAATSVDLTGVLEYFKVIGGSSISTMEWGAIITTGASAPFLAMGFSMAADLKRGKDDGSERDF
jgi:hypothetical protein